MTTSTPTTASKTKYKATILDKVIHNRYINGLNEFKHSLTVDGEEGKRVDYSQIARNGEYGATMSNVCSLDTLPRVFLVTEVLNYRVHSVRDTRLP